MAPSWPGWSLVEPVPGGVVRPGQKASARLVARSLEPAGSFLFSSFAFPQLLHPNFFNQTPNHRRRQRSRGLHFVILSNQLIPSFATPLVSTSLS